MPRSINQGRPQPLHAQVEDDVLDYGIFRSRALADGRLDAPETRALLSFADRLAQGARALTERDAAALALLAGRDGLRSDRFRERVTAANRGTVIPFPVMDFEPEPDPVEIRRAA